MPCEAMLTHRLHPAPGSTGPLSPEDVFASALSTIFPDDVRNQHGDAAEPVVYRSIWAGSEGQERWRERHRRRRRKSQKGNGSRDQVEASTAHDGAGEAEARTESLVDSPLVGHEIQHGVGDIHLTLADPDVAEERGLFAHALWNSAVQLAVLIEEGQNEVDSEDEDNQSTSKACPSDATNHDSPSSTSLTSAYDVRGLRVLELGAGSGLVGIVAALMGAREVVLSDYPAERILENLRANVARNVTARRAASAKEERMGEKPLPEISIAHVEVHGHVWGDVPDKTLTVGATAAATPPPPTTTPPAPSALTLQNRHAFDLLLLADCLWMPWQHEALRRSVAWFLRAGGRAHVVAGFHTGRARMCGFFAAAALRRHGLRVASILERDVVGRERAWVEDRGSEDPTERKRWLVLAVLVKDEEVG